RLAAHRRRRAPGRGRLPAAGRPHQGHDHPRRREPVPQGDRERDRAGRGRPRGRRGRPSRRGPGRGPGRLRRHVSRRHAHGGGRPGALRPHADPRQGARGRRHRRGAAEEPRRKDRQAHPAPARAQRLTHRERSRYMGFTTADMPPVDPEQFEQMPVMDRMRMLALHWADYGFGGPKQMHALYLIKTVVFIAGGWLVVGLTTPGLGLFDLGGWWQELIVYQKLMVWIVLWEITGHAA